MLVMAVLMVYFRRACDRARPSLGIPVGTRQQELLPPRTLCRSLEFSAAPLSTHGKMSNMLQGFVTACFPSAPQACSTFVASGLFRRGWPQGPKPCETAGIGAALPASQLAGAPGVASANAQVGMRLYRQRLQRPPLPALVQSAQGGGEPRPATARRRGDEQRKWLRSRLGAAFNASGAQIDTCACACASYMLAAAVRAHAGGSTAGVRRRSVTYRAYARAMQRIYVSRG